MLDLKWVRANLEETRKGIQDRGGGYLSAFEEMIQKDQTKLQVLKEVEDLRARKNSVSEKISRAKPGSPEHVALIKEANEIKSGSKEKEARLAQMDQELDSLLSGLPNLPHPSVPFGKTPEENKVLREEKSARRNFDFPPKDHHDLGEALGILDFKTASKISGARFALLKGDGARLERALIQFMLDVQTQENGYLEIFPPFLVSAQSMTGTGQLPKFEEELYKVHHDGLYLIPTAEVPLTNMHRDETLAANRLPLRYAAYTACFRREAGSYGKDTRGLIRNHQFNKIELVWFTRPEDSLRDLESLIGHAEEILRRLKLSYRVLELCTGDLGFASRKTYDLEVWMPGENKYREISSCSNFWDFQARRIGVRVKKEKGSELVHTLNGSGLAVGRTFAAVLENYQLSDGSIEVPEALRPYLKQEVIKG